MNLARLLHDVGMSLRLFGIDFCLMVFE